MTKKWQVTEQAHLRMETLDKMVQERTRALESANAELRRSEERFAKAFRASPIAVRDSNAARESLLGCQRRLSRMTGFRRDELLGRTPADLSLSHRF